MTPILNRYATPLTVGLFAISAVSGVALFFHVQRVAFHGMHEWLSLVLLVPFGLHLWKNWGAMLGYLRRRTLLLPVAAAVVAAVLFAVPALSVRGEPEPRTRAVDLMTQMRLAELAPVLKTTPDKLQTRLQRRGYKVDSEEETLAAVATASGTPAVQLLYQMLPAS